MESQTVEAELFHKIIEENKRVHAKEYRVYDDTHPELYNFYNYKRFLKNIDFLKDMLPPEPKVLDIGCGTGYALLAFLKKGFIAKGVDLSEEMTSILKKNTPHHLKKNVDIVNGNIFEVITHDTEQYDVVCISSVLHHIPDIEKLIKLCIPRIKKNGFLFTNNDPLKQNISSIFRYKIHRLLAIIDDYIYTTNIKLKNLNIDLDYTYSDYHRTTGGISSEGLAQMLESGGFKVRLQKYCVRRYGISTLIADRLLKTCNTFEIIARKV